MTDRLPFAGRVKIWKHDRGYGFVTRDGDRRDAFLHAETAKKAQVDDLEAGDRVRFDCVADGFGRLRIYRARVAGTAPPGG